MKSHFIFMAVLLFLNLLHSSWAKENPPVMVYAIGPSGSTYYDKDPGGKYEWKGLFIDILVEVMVKELGMKQVVQQSPWKRAQENVKDGTAEIIVSVPPQNQRDNKQTGAGRSSREDSLEVFRSGLIRIAFIGKVL